MQIELDYQSLTLKGQQKKVYDYLVKHGVATHREMVINLWVNYPEKCIELLRCKGINIKTVPVEGQKYNNYVLGEL